MSVEDKIKHLRGQQDEVLAAMIARKGDVGEKYVELVKEAASTCTALAAAANGLNAPQLDALFRHAATCVIAHGVMGAFDLQKVPRDTIDKKLTMEFGEDVVMLSKFMMVRCKPEDLKK